MTEQRVKIINRLGLHARAAAQLVRTASTFDCLLRLERVDGSASADAKSILSVLLLAASCGTELLLAADGSDERMAVEALATLIAEGFGEDQP
jgi:phosphotransferase system HPr (HPr) family protein